MTKPNKSGASPLLYIILLIIGVCIGGGGVWFLLSRTELPGTLLQADGQAAGVNEGKRIKYWQAPMDPTYVRDEPGKSPMGMDLIPVYESEGGFVEPGTVMIDPVTSQNIGVRTKKIEETKLTKTIRTVGRVDYDEKRVHHVNTKIEGWIEKLYVDFTGQEVKKNDYLLEIYSPKLVATQEEYLLAKSYEGEVGKGAVVTGGESMLELAKKRLELWDVPAHQIMELEETGQIKRTIHVHSPARGIVIKKNVQEGMFVKPGLNLYTIADLARVWVYADVYEYEMAWVSVGQSAEMTLGAYPGRVFKGSVAFINPFMEPKTRTVKVRLEFDNTDGKLKPDMFANVTLKSQRKDVSVVVPAEAVLLSGERSVVVVARGDGKFTPTEVVLGVEAGGYYEVLEGLKAGDEVVTSAHFLIDSESRLKEAISKMLELKEDDNGSSPAKGMDSGAMPHEGMDNGAMKHEEMKHEEMDHGAMKDEEMEHGEVEHEEMDHGAMGHEGMDR